MKKLTTAIIAIALVAIGLLLVKSCRLDDKYQKMRDEYIAFRANVEAETDLSIRKIVSLEEENAELRAEIQFADTVIQGKDHAIAALKGKVSSSTAEVAKLRTEIQPALDANPKLAEFVASLDAGITLRDGLIAEQSELILTLKKRVELGDERFANQVAISEEWKASYEREHKLRLMSEEMTSTLEKQIRVSKLRGKLATAALVVAGGTVIYSLVK